MQGLEALGQLDQADRVVVDTLAPLPIEIETCGGWMFGTATSESIFGADTR